VLAAALTITVALLTNAHSQIRILNMHDTDSMAPGAVCCTPNYVRDAAARLGASLTVVGTQGDFRTQFDSAGPWDMVIYSAWTNGAIGTTELDRLVLQVAGGGTVIVNSFNLYATSSVRSHGFFTNEVQVSFSGDYSSVIDLYAWMPSHPIWTTPNQVAPIPLPTSPISRFVIDGQYADALPPSIAVGGYGSGSPTPTNAGIIVNSSGTVIVNTFTPQQYAQTQIVDLLENQIEFLRGGVRIQSVDAVPAQVAPGQSGAVVSMTVENSGSNPVSVTTIDLTMTDAGMVDRSSEYTVNPDPANPTIIAAGGTEVLAMMVDVSPMATLGTITLDGTIDVVDQVTMAPSTATGAAMTDTWDVVGAVAEVRTVDTPVTTVSQGGTGYPVTVDVENIGLNPVRLSALTLTFTGSADRTPEYLVTPDPANPAVIAPATTESFAFSVDVDPAATIETITLDAGFAGTDDVSGAPVNDADSDVTDSWDVVPCAASLCGDCNGDMTLSILDALLAAQHAAAIVTLTGTQFSNCNVIGLLEPAPGAVVDILDALTLAQAAAGLPVTLTCC
jgi:hypothetical protein